MKQADTLQRIERLEQKMQRLNLQLRRCVDHPKRELYPHFPEIITGTKGLVLLLGTDCLIVKKGTTEIGRVVFKEGG